MSDTKPLALLGNFKEPSAVYHAAEAVRDAGYKDFDIYTPYPIHGLDKAMGVKRTILPYISFTGAMIGLASAVGLIMWTGAIDYKLNIGGKPLFAVEFGVPVMFELTVLLTALFTFVGLFALCGLPKWYSDFQHDEGFRAAVDDTFVVAINVADERFSMETTKKMLMDLGAQDVRLVEA